MVEYHVQKNKKAGPFSRVTVSSHSITSLPHETQANCVALLEDTPTHTQLLLFLSLQASSLSLVFWRNYWLRILKPDSLSSDLGRVLCPHQASGML